MVTPDTVPLCARPSVFSVAKDDKSKREVASSFEQEKQMKKQSSFDMVNPLAKNKLAKNKPVPAQPHCAVRFLALQGAAWHAALGLRRTLTVRRRGYRDRGAEAETVAALRQALRLLSLSLSLEVFP